MVRQLESLMNANVDKREVKSVGNVLAEKDVDKTIVMGQAS